MTQKTEDILQVQGINSKGYGLIPKLVMQDKRLSIQAKGIYAYFSSFAGNGETAFPTRNKILHDLRINKNTYYRYFNELKDCGFISCTQKRESGKFLCNVYAIMQVVESDEPCLKDSCPKKQDTTIRDTTTQDTNNNSINNNSFKNNSLVSQSSTDGQDGQDRQDGQEMIRLYEMLIHKNIGYRDLVLTNPEDIPLIDEFVSIMLDVMVSQGEYIRIGNENKLREVVKSFLLKLTYDNIIHVLSQFKKQQATITNKRQYILVMLYYSTMEINAHYENQVNSDGYRNSHKYRNEYKLSV